MRAALRGEAHDYTRGSLTRAIWLLAVPMVLELAMESVFAVVDVFLVARIGIEAVAAVGLTEAMLTIVYAFAIGFSMAATALVARRIGEGNRDGAVRAATAAIALGIGVGVVLGIPCVLFAERMLAAMQASDEVIAVGGDYARIVLGGSGVVLLLHLNNAIFRGAGDPVVAMRALWLANAVNLALDPCLIFGLGPFPELGVAGAGLGTLIGRSVGVLYQWKELRRGSAHLALRGPGFRLGWPVLVELLRLSVGGVTQFLIATASWVALMRIVSPFGKDAVAGYTIAVRIVVFAILPAWGLSNSAATLVGQNLGARQPERAARSVWLTGLYNMAFLAFVSVVFLVFSPALVRLFTGDLETAAIGVRALRTLSYGYVFYAWGMVMAQAFNGAGDTLTPTWLNLFCFWGLQIPLAWTLAHPVGLGPGGVFWSVCLAESVLALASIAVFRRGRWKKVQLAPDVAPDARP